ncbi:MAG: Bacterial-like globin, partial [Micromonosporaceae bacterium]
MTLDLNRSLGNSRRPWQLALCPVGHGARSVEDVGGKTASTQVKCRCCGDLNRATAPCNDRGMVRTPGEPSPTIAGPELFAALGGRRGVGMIVDGLYDRLERDRELARLFRSHRSGERERLKEFFETIFGGEVRGIRDVGMQRRHVHR